MFLRKAPCPPPPPWGALNGVPERPLKKFMKTVDFQVHKKHKTPQKNAKIYDKPFLSCIHINFIWTKHLLLLCSSSAQLNCFKHLSFCKNYT